MENIRTVEEIINDAGGAAAVAEACAAMGLAEKPIHLTTIHKWRVNGIPEKLWRLLIEHAGATPAELHAVNEAIRNNKRKPGE